MSNSIINVQYQETPDYLEASLIPEIIPDKAEIENIKIDVPVLSFNPDNLKKVIEYTAIHASKVENNK